MSAAAMLSDLEARAARDLAMVEKAARSKSVNVAAPAKPTPNPAIDLPPEVQLIRASTITPEPIRWLWPGWLARGKLHVLAGAPGTGKTTIALRLAAIVSHGANWPSGTLSPRGSVLIWSGEDDPADTLVPRLMAAGADLDSVHFVGMVKDGKGARSFDPATDMEALQHAALLLDDLALMIVDPIVSAVAGDSHKNTEVRRALQPLVDLGAHVRCAVLGISHFSKGTSGRDPVERVTGSIALGAVARIVLATAKQQPTDGEEGEARHLLVRAKSNIGPDSGGYVYAIEQVEADPDGAGELLTSRVQFGAPIEGSARELLSQAEEQPDEDNEERRDAVVWLKELLSSGAVLAKDVRKHGDDAGFPWRTLQRAMRRAGVESKRAGYGKPAYWTIVSGASCATVAPVAPNSELGANGATDGANAETGATEVDL